MRTVPSAPPRERGDDALDGLFEDARRDSVEFPTTLANHAPMVLAILDRLGASRERLERALVRYREARRLVPVPAPVRPIDRASWMSPLGDRAREADYRAFFAREVAASGWEETLRRFLPPLLPGIAGSALHPSMRLAYAILRRDPAEVAVALAYWACCFLPLRPAASDPLTPPVCPDEAALPSPLWRGVGGEGPGARPEAERPSAQSSLTNPHPLPPLHKGEGNGGQVWQTEASRTASMNGPEFATDDPAAILMHVVALPGLRTLPKHALLWHGIRAAAADPDFTPAVDRLRIGPDTLRRMAETSLALYVGTMHFAALHAVTATHWVRLIQAACPDPALLRHSWRTIAALVPAIGCPDLPPDELLRDWRRRPCPSWPDITAAALRSDDEHDVSLVFSAREEQKAYGDRLYRVVAARRLGLIA